MDKVPVTFIIPNLSSPFIITVNCCGFPVGWTVWKHNIPPSSNWLVSKPFGLFCCSIVPVVLIVWAKSSPQQFSEDASIDGSGVGVGSIGVGVGILIGVGVSSSSSSCELFTFFGVGVASESHKTSG